LSRCWDEETVLEADVMESRSLWNLRFEVAIASGMFATSRVVYEVFVSSRSRKCELYGRAPLFVACKLKGLGCSRAST
jgi:hypothetical protein